MASDGALIINTRHRDAVRQTLYAMKRVVRSIKKRLSSEFIAVDLIEAANSLGGILGETVTESILDKIFSEFCIGK